MNKMNLLLIIAVAIYLFGCGKGLEVHITSLNNNSMLPCTTYVEGTITDPNAEVWIVVHPMSTKDFYVGNTIGVREAGSPWKVLLFVGTCGDSIFVGQHFEIRAISNPKANLYKEKTFRNWPESEAKSQVVEVIRQ